MRYDEDPQMVFPGNKTPPGLVAHVVQFTAIDNNPRTLHLIPNIGSLTRPGAAQHAMPDGLREIIGEFLEDIRQRRYEAACRFINPLFGKSGDAAHLSQWILANPGMEQMKSFEIVDIASHRDGYLFVVNLHSHSGRTWRLSGAATKAIVAGQWRIYSLNSSTQFPSP